MGCAPCEHLHWIPYNPFVAIKIRVCEHPLRFHALDIYVWNIMHKERTPRNGNLDVKSRDISAISQREPKCFTSFACFAMNIQCRSQYKVNRKIESAKSVYSFDSNPSIVHQLRQCSKHDTAKLKSRHDTFVESLTNLRSFISRVEIVTFIVLMRRLAWGI